MASEISTIQSLKAVDAWIDVINANINGGVRTAFKTSRLKFSGSNTDVARAGTGTSLPLQFPEPGLTTANTVIDFSQGAVTASTENAHLAIQGEGFFVLLDPVSAAANGDGQVAYGAGTKVLLTRDGEFTTNKDGWLVHAATGFFLVSTRATGGSLASGDTRRIYNDMDLKVGYPAGGNGVRLSDFLNNAYPPALDARNLAFTSVPSAQTTSIVQATLGKQMLRYSRYGSTVYEFDIQSIVAGVFGSMTIGANLRISGATTADATILNKSLEASNASMTQSVPELSLAQKLFSALTKVLQTKQTNVDGVLNLVR
jgi:flagellar hook protein FlgE